MKNGGLAPSLAEPEGGDFCITLHKIKKDAEGPFTENLYFLTQDVHLG
jgi:hypothetical protein